MFSIIGGDGKEYGPVTTDQVRTWISSGRANLDTKAKAAGTEEWRRLGDFAEFGSGAVVAPPPLAGGSAIEASELAGLGSRLGAILLDRLIALVCALPGLTMLGWAFIKVVLMASRGVQPDLEGMDVGRILVGLALFCFAQLALGIVQIWMLSVRGQTIGKRLLKIRVVRYRDGAPAGFVHGWLLRSLVPGIITMIPYLGLIFWLVDICFIFREDRRCIHDLIADTRVVKSQS